MPIYQLHEKTKVKVELPEGVTRWKLSLRATRPPVCFMRFNDGRFEAWVMTTILGILKPFVLVGANVKDTTAKKEQDDGNQIIQMPKA